MPRKDPMTGLPVLTTAELFEKEAENEGEGRSGGELMTDFMEEDEATTNERAQLESPEGSLAFIQDISRDWHRWWIQEWRDFLKHSTSPPDCEKPPWPVAVYNCHLTNSKQNFSGSNFKMEGIADLANGKRMHFEASDYHYAGSYWQPPESENEILWTKLTIKHKLTIIVARIRTYLLRQKGAGGKHECM